MLPNEKLLINLKILGRIPKNGKIQKSSYGIISIETDSYLTSLRRFVTQDGRFQSIMEISNIIDDAIYKTKEITNSKYFNPESDPDKFFNLCKYLDLIMESLQNSSRGIENLKTTYKTDLNIISQIEVILLKIKGCVYDIQIVLEDNNYEKDTEDPFILNMFPIE